MLYVVILSYEIWIIKFYKYRIVVWILLFGDVGKWLPILYACELIRSRLVILTCDIVLGLSYTGADTSRSSSVSKHLVTKQCFSVFQFFLKVIIFSFQSVSYQRFRLSYASMRITEITELWFITVVQYNIFNIFIECKNLNLFCDWTLPRAWTWRSWYSSHRVISL